MTQLLKALTEQYRRTRARESLVDYSQAIVIPGAPMHPDDVDGEDPNKWVFQPIETRVAIHHRVTMQAIQDCIEEDSGRLMIFEPPGSAKSTYACVVGATWFLGRKPNVNCLMVSSSGIPIIRASKKARQVARSAEFRNIWQEPTDLPRGSTAADEWALTNGSTMFAAGILGGIVGSRADLVIIDDPVAGREEADSETTRRKIKQAYEDDVLTRMKPKASVILIQTRWHEDDLAGSILPEGWKGESGRIMCRDGQVWNVLCIPAECDNPETDPLGRKLGEMIWPEWFNERHWATFRRNPRTWSALYQQNPQPSSGGQFTKDMFHRFNLADVKEMELTMFGTGDFAVTKKVLENNPDYTVLGPWGIDVAGDLWLFPGWYGREGPVTVTTEWLKLLLHNDIKAFAAEAGVIRRAMEPILNAAQDAAKKWIVTEWLPSTGDKIAKVQGFRGLASHGKVHVVNGPFGDYVIAQLCAFPFAKFDDAVDMCGLAGEYADRIARPEEPEPVEPDTSAKPFTEQMWNRMTDREREEEQRQKDYLE